MDRTPRRGAGRGAPRFDANCADLTRPVLAAAGCGAEPALLHPALPRPARRRGSARQILREMEVRAEICIIKGGPRAWPSRGGDIALLAFSLFYWAEPRSRGASRGARGLRGCACPGESAARRREKWPLAEPYRLATIVCAAAVEPPLSAPMQRLKQAEATPAPLAASCRRRRDNHFPGSPGPQPEDIANKKYLNFIFLKRTQEHSSGCFVRGKCHFF